MCKNCGKLVSWGEEHSCTEYNYVWPHGIWINHIPTYQPSVCDNNPYCSRENCIYHPYGNDKYLNYGERRCQNKSVKIDKDGTCISFVDRNKLGEKK